MLYYLNHTWAPGDGGELRIYGPAADENDNSDTPIVRDVEPVADRLVVFYSDTRVPHEVRRVVYDIRLGFWLGW